MALLVMDEPQVGPTVVMLTLSATVFGTALAGDVVVVVVDRGPPSRWSSWSAWPSWSCGDVWARAPP